MYPLLLFIHILSVILSLGPFFVLIPLLSKMKWADAPQLNSYLDSFHFAVRLSKHSGHVLVFSGVMLLWLGPWPWYTSWIAATLAVLFGTLFFIARAFSPTIRKLRDVNQDRDKLLKKLSRALYFYIFIMILMLWLMVSKPTLWH